MQLTTLLLLPLLAATASAHTRVYSVWANGKDQGDGRGKYIRSPPNNNPVKDVTSSALKCNVADTSVGTWISAKAGDMLTFEWYHDTHSDDIIDSSHKGPVLVHIQPSSDGQWTKIAHDGLKNGVWAVDKLISNKGKYTVKIPASLKAGNYLFRAEVIALHEAETNWKSNNDRGAQFQIYSSCSQIKITSGGSKTPPGGVKFPGTYSATDPGILFNLYSSPTSYTIPGGRVWTG